MKIRSNFFLIFFNTMLLSPLITLIFFENPEFFILCLKRLNTIPFFKFSFIITKKKLL